MSFSCRLFSCLLLGAAVSEGIAEERKLRELTTDRPDSTESPFTVDPGHVQLEMDFANHVQDKEEGTRTTEWEAAPFNLRWGLTPNVEAGVFITPCRRVTETLPGGPRTRETGFGDVVLRGKWNLRGNDGGAFAWGLMADVKLPTAKRSLGNGKVEGALTLPIAFELGGGWGGGAMTSVEWNDNGAGRHRPTWVNTLTVSREIVADLGGFLEVASAAGDGSHVATFNCGLTRALDANTQLDAGINVGISRAAPDLLLFAGMSRRF